MKFFHIDKRFDVICSGSMLGINYQRIESNSVGYKTDYEMHSLDFESSFGRKGYSDDVVEGMFSHLVDLKPFSDTEMDLFLSLFVDYCTLEACPRSLPPT